MDADTARSLEILVAAGEIAAMNPRKPPRRWRDPIMVALVLFGVALVGIGIGLNVLAGAVHQGSQQRKAQIGGLTTQINGLEDQIGTLSALAKENADNLATDATHIAQLEHQNARLVRLVQKLCAINPNNARCVHQLTVIGSASQSLLPQPQTPVTGRAPTVASSPTDTPSSGPSTHPTSRPSGHPTTHPSTTPTPRLTLPTICLPAPLPCI